MVKIHCDYKYLRIITTESVALTDNLYLCNRVSRCAFGKIIVDFGHRPLYCVHNLQSIGKNVTLLLNYSVITFANKVRVEF